MTVRFAFRAAVVALAPLVLRLLLLPWMGEPYPRVQDEFSHLLAADTFAQGRLVNPEHPLWMHFESVHILVRPVYASVYPVAHGLVMAAGQKLTGHPWVGVWLAMGLMCAALHWMLAGWVSPGWAWLGALLAAARFGVFSYWMNSYYGGAVAAAGGALVLGALPRLIRRPGWRDAAIFAAGLVVLANSRPYEGALLAAPAIVALVWRRRVLCVEVLAPCAVVLGLAGAAMGVYFARVTGSPWRLPYSYYRETSTLAPHFVWQAPRPEPVYLHAALWRFHTGWEMGCYRAARAGRAPHGPVSKAMSYWRFYLGPVLTIPLLALWWTRRRRLRWLLGGAALFCAGLAVEVWHAPHYAAPALGLALLLVTLGLKQVQRKFGPKPVWVLAVAAMVTPVVGGSAARPGPSGRASFEQRLAAEPGRHLVLVRYGPRHDPGDEWVYNAAAIDTARIVWAREMDPGSNARLLQYYAGRRVWLAEPDAAAEPRPFDPAQLPDPPFRFVPLGTPAIEAVRDAERVRGQVRERAATGTLTCDQWNYYFTQATGVGPPDPAQGCTIAGGQRSDSVAFDAWFTWLARQK